MNHGMLICIQPLTLIEIIVIFRNPRRIHDPKIGTFYRRVVLIVPRGRLTDIVHSCPNKLTRIV